MYLEIIIDIFGQNDLYYFTRISEKSYESIYHPDRPAWTIDLL